MADRIPRIRRLPIPSDALTTLDRVDAADLGLDPDELTYVTIGELDGSSDKALRDAESISVTNI